MSFVFGWIRPLFVVGAFALAGFLATSNTAPPILAQGASYCELMYPGDPYCHDDLLRPEGEENCVMEGCHTKKAICCLPD